MLTGSRLGHDAPLPHSHGEKRLPDLPMLANPPGDAQHYLLDGLVDLALALAREHPLIILIVALLGYFGFETTSFAALLAGVGLAELYELDSNGRTVNLSTRAYVRTDDGVLIGGFVLFIVLGRGFKIRDITLTTIAAACNPGSHTPARPVPLCATADGRQIGPASARSAIAITAAAFFAFGLQMPRTSPSRTVVHPRKWNFVLNPLPTKPTPSRSPLIVCPPCS